jgi:hypothetical protein
MVKGADGVPYYCAERNLMPCDAAGTPDFSGAGPVGEPTEDDPLPAAVVPIVETRLNLNTATAEDLAKHVPGLAYRVAKAIKDLQTSLPNERFVEMDQLRPVSQRTNWDEIFKANAFYLG